MKHFILTLAFVSTCIFQVKAQETLTNLSIVQMVAMGFDQSIIESKINTSSNDFDVSTSALLALQQDSVPNAVIAAMMTAANDPSKKVVDMNDFRTPHRPGIYYYDAKGDLVELLSTVTNGTKTRNRLGSAYSYGISKAKVVSQVSGTEARLSFKKVPKFYFYFNQQTSSFDNQGLYYGFGTASSPNEFVLARMEIRKGTRELVVFSVNSFTQEHGVNEKQAVSYEISQVDQGIFEVSVGDIGPGQYCFLYSGSAPSSQTRVYDFGIR